MKAQPRYAEKDIPVQPLPDVVKLYFIGERPEAYGKSWEDVDYIYAPCFIGDDHWIALQVDLLYDEEKIQEEVFGVSKYLPLHISNHEPLEKKIPDLHNQLMKINRVTNLKQNNRRLRHASIYLSMLALTTCHLTLFSFRMQWGLWRVHC